MTKRGLRMVSNSLAMRRASDRGHPRRHRFSTVGAGQAWQVSQRTSSISIARGAESGGWVFAGANPAVINKRAGGMGLISGRKAFQRPMNEGVKPLNTIQDVYADKTITVA
jgi:hypothetical protein